MTFGKLRRVTGNKSEDGKWELLRFCNLNGHQIVGGANKLLSHFKKKYKPKHIISYCDRRWSHGSLYENLNFELTKETVPNYWYLNTKSWTTREHRFNFRKNILVKQGADPSQSEASIMADRGYVRIYDCGSLKYELLLLD